MTWGGKRENSGRKPKEEKKKAVSLYLTELEKKQLEEIDKNITKAVKFLLNNYSNLKK